MKHDGYYLGAPSSYIDYVAGNNKRTGIIHSAYLFTENGVVKRRSKETKDEIVGFTKEDFENAHSGEYTTKEDFLYVIFDKNQKWEVRITFKLNEDQMVCIESNTVAGAGQIYEFHKF